MEKFTKKHIKDFLEETPLYTWKEFNKYECDNFLYSINEVELFCEHCQRSRPFQKVKNNDNRSLLMGDHGIDLIKLSTPETENFHIRFSCVSCKNQDKEYLVQQIATNETIKIQKYGELPRKAIERDNQLQKFFSNDLDSYEKSIMCLANGYGIGAFVYMRRIIESNIDDLLDMLQESTEDNEIRAELSKLKKKPPMSEKIKIANNALPEYLLSNGLNPLGKLYKILSEGVHTYSDEECLERANILMSCIKILISELATRKKHLDSLASSIGAL